MNKLSKELAIEAQSLLFQLRAVLENLEDSTYNSPISILSNVSIGAHTRHTLEFFECFQQGDAHKEINYDLRKRDLELEVSREAALSVIQQLAETFSGQGQQGSINLISQGPDGTTRKMASSRERELWYTIEHAIHHMAIIKIGILYHDSSFVFPENFGVASSTVIFQQLQNQ